MKPRWVAHSVQALKSTDWLYGIDGRAYGGFTVNAMRAEMDPAA